MKEGAEQVAEDVAQEVLRLGNKIKALQDESTALAKLRAILMGKMHTELEMTQREIATACHMSQPRVGQILSVTKPYTQR